MDQSIWELLNHGGGAMWVVVAFSVIALAVGIERAIAQWKFVTRARALGETVTRCLSRGALEDIRVFVVGVDHGHAGRFGAAAFKEDALGCEVLFYGLVVVQVIACEIGEERNVEFDA